MLRALAFCLLKMVIDWPSRTYYSTVIFLISDDLMSYVLRMRLADSKLHPQYCLGF